VYQGLFRCQWLRATLEFRTAFDDPEICFGIMANIAMVIRSSFYRFNNSLADPFGYLWDNGVSETSQSVHPTGNPISHSTHSGFNCPLLLSAVFTAPSKLPPP
jgi:hypothetical protein